MSRTFLLLLPGLLCDEWLWHAQVAGLNDIAEPFVADLSRDDTVGAMAARALELAPPTFALAGLSMGGYVAFEVMRQAPHRVERLALFSTGAGPDSGARAVERRRAATSLRYGRFTLVTNTMLRQLVHRSQFDTPLGKAVQAMADRVGAETLLHQQKAIENRPDSIPLLSTITVPTLVGVGDSDLLTPPEQSRLIHEQIPHSVLHVFTNCGHLPALEAADETTRLMREWLRR